MIRRLIFALALFCLIFTTPVMAAPAVHLDGRPLSFDISPTIENGRTLVPLRAIFEAMGASVDWDQTSRTATAVKGGTRVSLKIGSLYPTVNGQVQALEVPAKIVNGRILAPLRFVAESFGGDVLWEARTQRISISTTRTHLKVHFLDVGQADSILIQLPNGQTMLVDAGNNEDGAGVVRYLKQEGISKIDYLVGTHPHEDHIGGLDNVMLSLDIGKFYLPAVLYDTRSYQEVIFAAQERKLAVTPAKAGDAILQSGNLSAYILAPGANYYADVNNYSVVVRIEYGEQSFLLTGDAEDYSEFEMLASSRARFASDVLKVAHHGSGLSTSPGFLQAVDPDYAVISVGADNDYGNPHESTLRALADSGAEILRTDRDGTVIFETDGQSMSVQKLGDVIPASAPAGSYIGNKQSRIFHRPSCLSLPLPTNQVLLSREEAISQGYAPCHRCEP